ncbi:Gp19/Gp15/Gp42 family protein [Isoptericola sp. NPDC056134]|uniref:Gp19/Gp15/Gp42 family protein n=1 Tax=Isoptericola sp. NPDC056134 TaxID=3345723 RepID=UPI0035EF6971
MADPLLTAAEFSAGTGGKIAADDPRVQKLLDGATRAIRRYCGWHVAPVLTETVKLDGPGGSLLRLPTLRLVDITVLKEGGVDQDVESLEWSEKGMIRRRHGCWTDRFRGIEATIEHGFEDADDVKQIIQQVVANAISSPLGATSEAAGALSVSWATTAPGVSGGLSLLERDLAVLELYRLEKAA